MQHYVALRPPPARSECAHPWERHGRSEVSKADWWVAPDDLISARLGCVCRPQAARRSLPPRRRYRTI